MEFKNLTDLLNLLTTAMKENEFGEDKPKIQYFYNELEKTKTSLPATEKLEELHKIEIDLEVKYEVFYEINSYFDPYYVFLKKRIHDENIKKIRKENRKKRQSNS